MSKKREIDLGRLADALEKATPWGRPDLKRLSSGNSSLNFSAEAGGFRYLVKMASKERIAHVAALLKDVQGPGVMKHLLDGAVLEFDGLDMVLLEWMGGHVVEAEDLAPCEIDSFVDSYDGFSKALQGARDVRPPLDIASMKRILVSWKGVRWCPPLKILLSIPDDEIMADERELRTIHGDLHFGNVHFEDGRVAAFLDFEMARKGTKAEDLMRGVAHRFERLGPFAFSSRRRLLAVFARIVERSGLGLGMWLQAVDSYWLRKCARRVDKSRFAPFAALDLAVRSRLYLRMRDMVLDLKVTPGESR